MTENSKIKTVFLDWYGTLSISTFWQHWMDPEHPKYKYSSAIEDFFRNSGLVHPWMRGQITAEDFTEKMEVVVGLDQESLLKGLRESSRAMQFVSPEIPGLITDLRAKGKKVIIATDNMDTFPRWTIPAMNLPKLVDGILDSHTLGILKEDFDEQGKNTFFGNYLNYHEILEAEAILFDDNEKVTEIAARCGMIGVKLSFGSGLVEQLQKLVIQK